MSAVSSESYLHQDGHNIAAHSRSVCNGLLLRSGFAGAKRAFSPLFTRIKEAAPIPCPFCVAFSRK